MRRAAQQLRTQCRALLAATAAAGALLAQNARSAMTSDPDASILLDARNAVAATNDPWISVPLSMGLEFEVKDSRVMSLCKTGKLIKTEETNGSTNIGGNVIEIDEPDKDGALTDIQHIQPRPNYASPVQIYHQGTELSDAPTPVPALLSRLCGGDKVILKSLKNGDMQAFASGMLVTRDCRILFWQLEDLNTISLTSDGRKWYFLESDLSPAEAVKDLSWGKGYDAPPGPLPPVPPPEIALTPPLPSDVAAVTNYPRLFNGPSVRYEVDKATVLEFLKSGKRAKPGIRLFRQTEGTVGDFGADTRSRMQAANENSGDPFLPGERVQARGILVTRNYKFYIWLLHSDKALYLTDLKDHCWLTLN